MFLRVANALFARRLNLACAHSTANPPSCQRKTGAPGGGRSLVRSGLERAWRGALPFALPRNVAFVLPKKLLPLVFAISSVVLTTFSLRAESISLQPIADTTLIESAPGDNLSGATFFNAGTAASGKRNRGLVLFDISSIPDGSTITSA